MMDIPKISAIAITTLGSAAVFFLAPDFLPAGLYFSLTAVALTFFAVSYNSETCKYVPTGSTGLKYMGEQLLGASAIITLSAVLALPTYWAYSWAVG